MFGTASKIDNKGFAYFLQTSRWVHVFLLF